MSSLIEVQSVSQIFPTREGGATWALRDVSLQAGEGEFISLLGPSGCGKSTLLSLIAGFTQASRGDVLFEGEPIRQPGPERSVVFQEYALFAWMTALQNVEFSLRMQGLPKAERRARSLHMLDKVGLTHALNRYPHEMSGGMRQRVAVARALVSQPKVLLMDEPFAALDAMTRQTLQQELLALWKDTGVSVLFVTHNIDEAIFLSQRIVVMSAHPGHIQADIALDQPYPRDRGSALFGELYTHISGMLAH